MGGKGLVHLSLVLADEVNRRDGTCRVVADRQASQLSWWWVQSAAGGRVATVLWGARGFRAGSPERAGATVEMIWPVGEGFAAQTLS